MSTFEPRRVDGSYAKDWLTSGLELATRKAIELITMTIIFSMVYWLTWPISILLCPMLFPVLLSVGCIIAEAANNSQNAIEAIRQKPQIVWFRIFMLSMTPWLLSASATVSILIYKYGILPFEPSPALNVFSLPNEIYELSAMYFVDGVFPIGILIWFMVPLIAIAELPIFAAVVQTARAITRNWFTLLFVVAAGLTLFFCKIVAAWIVPWVAIMPCTMYVCYLDIWCGGSKLKDKTSQTSRSQSKVYLYGRQLPPLGQSSRPQEPPPPHSFR